MNDAHFGPRRFSDDHDVLWDVWEAHPRLAERRRARERRVQPRDGAADRRAGAAPQPKVELEGWLVFRSVQDVRRRAPIPVEWHAMTDDDLRTLLRRSRATGARPRARATASFSSAPSPPRT